MTPEEAREVLATFLNEEVSQDQAEAELAYIQSETWLRTFPRPCRCEGSCTPECLAHKELTHRLCELHTDATIEERKPDGDLEAAARWRAEAEHIYAGVRHEVEAEVATHGLPPAWRPK